MFHNNPSKLTLSLCALFLLTSTACNQSSSPYAGKRAKVSGIVYYNGDPLSSGKILFISESPEGNTKSSGMISHGIYQISEEGGPLTGKARVEIYPRTPELEELQKIQADIKSGKALSNPLKIKIPEIYNKNSELTAEVTQDGKNSFDFKIESKE